MTDWMFSNTSQLPLLRIVVRYNIHHVTSILMEILQTNIHLTQHRHSTGFHQINALPMSQFVHQIWLSRTTVWFNNINEFEDKNNAI